ncbi:MAG: hypothetical protein WBA97_03060 [Actinophytocola sp.]|uniref:hypothetical protein n=1 Tax=Actinophytocola sp. TaxID=1872138 RepID=UPI003C748DF6
MSDSWSEARVAAVLGTLTATYAVVLIGLMVLLNEEQLAAITLSVPLCAVGSISLLGISALMAERVFAARRTDDSS